MKQSVSLPIDGVPREARFPRRERVHFDHIFSAICAVDAEIKVYAKSGASGNIGLALGLVNISTTECTIYDHWVKGGAPDNCASPTSTKQPRADSSKGCQKNQAHDQDQDTTEHITKGMCYASIDLSARGAFGMSGAQIQHN